MTRQLILDRKDKQWYIFKAANKEVSLYHEMELELQTGDIPEKWLPLE